MARITNEYTVDGQPGAGGFTTNRVTLDNGLSFLVTAHDSDGTPEGEYYTVETREGSFETREEALAAIGVA